MFISESLLNVCVKKHTGIYPVKSWKNFLRFFFPTVKFSQKYFVFLFLVCITFAVDNFSIEKRGDLFWNSEGIDIDKA